MRNEGDKELGELLYILSIFWINVCSFSSFLLNSEMGGKLLSAAIECIVHDTLDTVS